MALNFDLLQPANIGANFMAGRKEAQDMETGRLQQQEARMKLDDFQRKQAGLDKFLAAAKQRGKDGDPVDVANDYYEWAVSQRNPELITQAMTLAQTAAQRKKFNAMQNPNQLAGVARPVAPAGELGSGTFDPNAPAPTNALAPAAAPSAMTPSNALAAKAAAPDRIAEIKSRLSQLNQFRELPEAKAEAEMLVKEYDRLTTPHVVGGSLMSGSGSVIGTAPKEVTPPASALEFKLAQENPAFMQFLQQRAAATRPPRPEAAPRTQQVTLSDGSLGIVNMDTGVITPSTIGGATAKAKPSAFAEKTAAQKTQTVKDLNLSISELTEATKDGGLIDQSTGSYLGKAVDISNRVFGRATKGDIAAGKLQPIADLALKMVPRFEGPQSNADTTSYKQAAGQLADTSLPTEIRKQAGREVLRIMKARKDQFVTSDMASGDVAAPAAAPAAGGFKYLGKESN